MSTLTQKFNIINAGRDSLYYGQFRYMSKFFLKEASALRASNHEDIDSIIDVRRKWGWKKNQIQDSDVADVHTVFDYFQKITDPYKRVIYSNWVYVYTNDLSDVDYLCGSPLKFRGPITEAVITHEKGTVGHLEPKYKYRTYFTSHKPSNEQIESFHQFVKNCGDDVKLSPGFKEWLKSKNRYWIMDHHYIDHNDTKILTMVALIDPRFIRKTKPIVKINN